MIWTPSLNIIPNMTSNNTPSPYVISASTSHPITPPWQAFDGSIAGVDIWHTNTGNITGWIKVDLGAVNAAIVKKYMIQARDEAAEMDRLPREWTFEGSNNDADWDILDTVTGETGWSALEKRNFEIIDNVTKYRYYKLDITLINGDPTFCGNICVIEMYVEDTSRFFLIS